MARKTEPIQADVEAELKAQAESVVEGQELPSDEAIPNAVTRRALRDVEQGSGLTRYKDTEELFDKLGL